MKTPEPAVLLAKISVRWTQKRPQLAERIERATALVLEGKVLRDGENRWLVCASGGGHYVICAKTMACPCLDYRHHKGQPCKHLLAIHLLSQLAIDVEKRLTATRLPRRRTVTLSGQLGDHCRGLEDHQAILREQAKIDLL